MSNTIWIGLGGLKESGKTTVARAVSLMAMKRQARPFTLSFAHPFKAMAVAMLRGAGVAEGRTRALLSSDKDQPIPELGGTTARWLLQSLGTEWGRTLIHPDIWVMIAECVAERSDGRLIIFDDVRFANEAHMIQDRGGLIFRIERPGLQAADGHASEGLNYKADYAILNDGTPEDAALEIWSKIEGRL